MHLSPESRVETVGAEVPAVSRVLWALPRRPWNTGVVARSRGFTLVEMMIVVAIVAVLSMLAVVGYRKLINASHVTEATGMVQSIRVAQEAYHSETQQYANLSTGLTGDYYPPGAPVSGTLFSWGAAEGSTDSTTAGIVPWSVLPLHVDGPVLFGYAAIARAGGTGGDTPPTVALDGTASLSFAAPPPTDWYMISAEGDLDGDPSVNTHVYGTSITNQIFVVSEGR
jgi:prepilin-type N-terminal cleavage/methylation domain-containing protein